MMSPDPGLGQLPPSMSTSSLCSVKPSTLSGPLPRVPSTLALSTSCNLLTTLGLGSEKIRTHGFQPRFHLYGGHGHLSLIVSSLLPDECHA